MKMMPVLQSTRTNPKFKDLPNEIPFSILNEKMAQTNHQQSLDRLAERGGMGYEEIAANILGYSWNDIKNLPYSVVVDGISHALTKVRGMKKSQLLLAKSAEEAVEIIEELIKTMSKVAKLSLKSQQFGLQEVMKDQPFTNAERLHSELDDMNAAIEMLNEQCGLNYIPNREKIEAKKLKVEKYAKYSQELGEVDK